jgi:ATP-dependent RNA helicase DDX42
MKIYLILCAEPQVRSICNHVRPERQTQLFSATFKKRVEKLARDILTDPVRIVQGDVGEANQDVTQIVKLLNSPQAKWNWLLANLVEFQSTGSILIFVTKKVKKRFCLPNCDCNISFSIRPTPKRWRII